jgi:hypothetical protein
MTYTFLKVSDEAAFTKWYDNTLVPEAEKTQGWFRTRRYSLNRADDYAGTWGADHDLPIMIVHESAQNNIPSFESLSSGLSGVVSVLERRFEVKTVFELPDGQPQPR